MEFFFVMCLFFRVLRVFCFWTQLKNKKTEILRQQSGWIESLSFSPDGRFLASANDLRIADDSDSLIVWATEVNKKTERIKSRE
jgi:hypothetical protein